MNVNGVKISAVEQGMQGEKLGIQPGDFVVSYAGIPIFSIPQLSRANEYARRNGMSQVDLVILRNQELITLETLTDEKLGGSYSEETIDINEETMSSIPGFLKIARKPPNGQDGTLGLGLGLVVLGGVITAVTYSSASAGGHYVVPAGLFVVGFILVLKALIGLARSSAD